MAGSAVLAPWAKPNDWEFQAGGSPETTIATVPVLVVRAARMPARNAPS